MRHKKLMSDADKLMLKHHPQMRNWMTTEQLMEMLLRTIRAMSPDEKAHLRYEMRKSSGIAPKSGGCKPS